MPQKRNLGALELVRARSQTLVALQGQMLATLVGLPSGYNMDYQETKAPLIEAVHICRESLEVVALFAEHLSVDEERLRQACSSELFAADSAYELVQTGIPFRDAYREVAAHPTAQEPGNLQERLHARVSEGATGNLGLEQIAARIAAERETWKHRQETFTKTIASLIKGTF